MLLGALFKSACAQTAARGRSLRLGAAKEHPPRLHCQEPTPRRLAPLATAWASEAVPGCATGSGTGGPTLASPLFVSPRPFTVRRRGRSLCVGSVVFHRFTVR